MLQFLKDCWNSPMFFVGIMLYITIMWILKLIITPSIFALVMVIIGGLLTWTNYRENKK